MSLNEAVAERDRRAWELGDEANALKTTYGGGELQALADRHGVSLRTVQNSRTTARRYPPAARTGNSFSVHEILASQPDCIELVRSQSWSSATARALKARRKGRPVPVPVRRKYGDYPTERAILTGVCECCQAVPVTNTLPFEDHCHRHGWVRALLCQGCNELMKRIDQRAAPRDRALLPALVAIFNRCPDCLVEPWLAVSA